MTDTTLKAYTTDEVASILSLSVPQVRRLIQAGKLRARNTGKTYRIAEDAIREYLAGSDTPLASAS